MCWPALDRTAYFRIHRFWVCGVLQRRTFIMLLSVLHITKSWARLPRFEPRPDYKSKSWEINDNTTKHGTQKKINTRKIVNLDHQFKRTNLTGMSTYPSWEKELILPIAGLNWKCRLVFCCPGWVKHCDSCDVLTLMREVTGVRACCLDAVSRLTPLQ